MSDKHIIARKIQLFPVGDKEEVDRVYKYLRDGMYNQNEAMNQYMVALYVSAMQEISKEDRKELNNLYGRISTSKKGSAYSPDMEFAKGLPSGSWTMEVRNKFNKAVKDGLLIGRVSLPTYKKTNPLIIHVDYVRLRNANPHIDNGIYHGYDNHNIFLEHLYKKDLNLFIKFANGITFKIVLGSPHKSRELRSVFQNIFEEIYEVRGSSIQFDKTGKKIILNMSIKIPEKKMELDENKVVGVDLGIKTPAVCALNCNDYARKSIGGIDNFLRVRTQMQEERRRLQRALEFTTGGHGREKKLKKLDDLSKREERFVIDQNHKISRKIVEFAKEHNAKYINIEDLSDNNFSKRILRNWSYYQLQEYIKYKAEMDGIKVRKVNPYHTSQICSCCGHWEDGQRVSQAEFICKNPECKNYNVVVNADFNAARNIAMSTDFRKWSSKE